MGLIDFIKNKSKKSLQPIATKPTHSIARTGKAEAKKIEVDSKALESLSRTFIAFDVETTGLSAITDRIVEIGAVVFVNGTPTRTRATAFTFAMKKCLK